MYTHKNILPKRNDLIMSLLQCYTTTGNGNIWKIWKNVNIIFHLSQHRPPYPTYSEWVSPMSSLVSLFLWSHSIAPSKIRLQIEKIAQISASFTHAIIIKQKKSIEITIQGVTPCTTEFSLGIAKSECSDYK